MNYKKYSYIKYHTPNLVRQALMKISDKEQKFS